jgi:hypothetical protein
VPEPLVAVLELTWEQNGPAIIEALEAAARAPMQSTTLSKT